MDLYQRLESDMKIALKEGDSMRLTVLRMLISAVKMHEIDKGIKPQEADIIQILQRQIKQRRESIEQFTNGNRPDLAEKEMRELKVLETYMPRQLSQTELDSIVKAAMAETGALSKADMGKVMKLVMEKAKGKCDGKAASQAIMKLLQ